MSGDDLLSNPAVQSAVLPFLVAFIATGALGYLRFAEQRALASFGIALGFVAAYVVIVGVPAGMPRSAGEKVLAVAAGGAALGLILDLAGRTKQAIAAAVTLFPAATLYWIASPKLGRYQDQLFEPAVLTYGGLVVGAWCVLGMLRPGGAVGAAPAVQLIVAAMGLGAVALWSAAASIAQASMALAAAGAGFLAWNWPRSRFPFGAAALFGAVGTLAVLAAQVVLYTRASPWPVALLGLAFFSGPVARRLRPAGAAADPVHPLLAGAVSAVPVAMAVALAYLGTVHGNPYAR